MGVEVVEAFIIGMVAQYRHNVKTRVCVEGGVMRRDGGWRFPTRGGGCAIKKISATD